MPAYVSIRQHTSAYVSMHYCSLFVAEAHHLTNRGNVFVVPGVAVGERRALADACDLVPVVPPAELRLH